MVSNSAEPLTARLLNTKSATAYLGGSSRLLQRCVYARPQWIKPVYGRGKGGNNLYAVADLDTVVERLQRGERPPLLGCEQRAKEVQ